MTSGTISTGSDGAVSLVLGTGAEVGTARITTESEVKLPDASEKGHSLELLKGQLFLNISADHLKRRGNSEFKLKTPAALLAVKGTKFFSTTKDGKDVIGVHEGSVEVLEPASGSKITLTRGKAVEISPGLLGEMRELTNEETGLEKTYALAELEVTPLLMCLKKGTTWQAWSEGSLKTTQQDLLNWRRLNSTIMIEESSKQHENHHRVQITQDGLLQLISSANITRGFGILKMRAKCTARHKTVPLRDKLGAFRIPVVQNKQLIAFRFEVRAKHATEIRVNVQQAGDERRLYDYQYSYSDFKSEFRPISGGWQTVQIVWPNVDMPGLNTNPQSGGVDLENKVFFAILGQPQEERDKPAEPIVVEYRNFEVLSIP